MCDDAHPVPLCNKYVLPYLIVLCSSFQPQYACAGKIHFSFQDDLNPSVWEIIVSLASPRIRVPPGSSQVHATGQQQAAVLSDYQCHSLLSEMLLASCQGMPCLSEGLHFADLAKMYAAQPLIAQKAFERDDD